MSSTARAFGRRARRGLRLDQVVDARRAAADLRLGDLEKLEPRDAAQQLARLRADALGVGQVAGVVVGDAHRKRVRRRPARARRAARRCRARSPRSRPRGVGGSSASSTAYSFTDEPQPAALTTMGWTSAASKVSMVRRAQSIASSSRPAWLDSARSSPGRGGPRRRSPPSPAPGRRGVDPREELALHAAGQHADDGPAPPRARRARGCAARGAPAEPGTPSPEARATAARGARCARRPAAAAALVGRQRATLSRSRFGCGKARRPPRAATGRPAGGGAGARPARASPRSACRTARRRTGRHAAMQPRQASKCCTMASLIGSPSSPACIR